MPDHTALVAAVKAAVPNPPEWCLFWQWSWEIACMPRSEWASWVQAGGACLALYIAIRAPHWFAERERARVRRGHFALINLDLSTGRKLAQTYLDGKVKSPAYRVPLLGYQTALPALLGDETLDHGDAQAFADWYIDAVSFNDCLDLTAELRRDGGNWRGEVSRNRLKASHLIAGTDSRRPTRYDDAMIVFMKRFHSSRLYPIRSRWWRLKGRLFDKQMPADYVPSWERPKQAEARGLSAEEDRGS